MDWILITLSLAWTVLGSVFVCKVLCPLPDHANRDTDEENSSKKTYKTMLYNERIGVYKDYHSGFSWTVLFFGFWPALFRGDWKWAAIIFLCCWALWFPACIFFAIKYNELYVKDLIQSGYVITKVEL